MLKAVTYSNEEKGNFQGTSSLDEWVKLVNSWATNTAYLHLWRFNSKGWTSLTNKFHYVRPGGALGNQSERKIWQDHPRLYSERKNRLHRFSLMKSLNKEIMNKQNNKSSLRRGRESIMRFSTIYYLKYPIFNNKILQHANKKNVYLIHIGLKRQ